MSKTAISALQELMAAAQKPLPIYQEEGCINGIFQCSVHVNEISATGKGQTKKAAKQASAEQALKDLGSKTVTTLHLQSNNNQIHSPSAINYVGELNEYASMSGVSYPIYNLDHVTMQTQFVIRCCFLGHETHGIGGNKKSAKQDSAKNMLEKIRTLNTPILDKYLIASPKKTSIEINESEIKAVEKILNDMSFKHRQARTTPSENVLTPELDELSVDSDSLEDMENALISSNIKVDVNWMQSNPYVVCVCIKDTSFTILGAGETKNEALKKAYKDLLLIRKSGCVLNDKVFEFS